MVGELAQYASLLKYQPANDDTSTGVASGDQHRWHTCGGDLTKASTLGMMPAVQVLKWVMLSNKIEADQQKERKQRELEEAARGLHNK